jgi:integrase
MKLSDLKIKQARPTEKTQKIFDGAGLYLQVEPSGAKLWRYKYRFGGKEKLLALGKYPDVPLQEARRRHQEARGQLAQGIDPVAVKIATKTTKQELAKNSLDAVAREWFKVWKGDKAEGHIERTWRLLEKDILPYIGHIPVAEIKAPDVLKVCRRVQTRGVIETAHRAKATIGQVMRYAVATGKAERDPAADLKGALEAATSKHFPSMTDPQKVGELLRTISDYKGTQIVRCALALAPLVFVRPGELTGARWEDIDLKRKEWVFEYSKQRANKADKRTLIVPLSNQALAILKELQPLTGKGVYVLPGMRPGRPMNEVSINRALQAMGYCTQTEMCAHGFRAMARTLLAEQLRFDPQWIERQLSHMTKESLGESYDRTQYLDGRREMMQDWADYLDGLKAGKALSGKIRKKHKR